MPSLGRTTATSGTRKMQDQQGTIRSKAGSIASRNNHTGGRTNPTSVITSSANPAVPVTTTTTAVGVVHASSMTTSPPPYEMKSMDQQLQAKTHPPWSTLKGFGTNNRPGGRHLEEDVNTDDAVPTDEATKPVGTDDKYTDDAAITAAGDDKLDDPNGKDDDNERDDVPATTTTTTGTDTAETTTTLPGSTVIDPMADNSTKASKSSLQDFVNQTLDMTLSMELPEGSTKSLSTISCVGG